MFHIVARMTSRPSQLENTHIKFISSFFSLLLKHRENIIYKNEFVHISCELANK